MMDRFAMVSSMDCAVEQDSLGNRHLSTFVSACWYLLVDFLNRNEFFLLNILRIIEST